MAKELRFSLSGAEYASAPVKLERKKIYGWTDLVATDKQGEVCDTAYLMADQALLIPSGGYKQGTVDQDGLWVEKGNLTAYDKEVINLGPSMYRSRSLTITNNVWKKSSIRLL